MKKHNIVVILSTITLAVLLVFSSSAAGSAKAVTPSEAATAITGINSTDSGLEIRANRPFTYTIYKPSDPYRVVVEIPDADISAFKEVIRVDNAGITEVTPSQIAAPARMAKVDILLQSPSGVDSRYQNSSLVLSVKREDTEPAGAKRLAEVKGAGNPDPAAGKGVQTATEITAIDFDRSEGFLRVIIKGNGSMSPSVFTLKNKIVIDLPELTVRAAVPVTVPSPIKRVKASKKDDKTRVEIDLNQPIDFDVVSVQDTIIVALKTGEEAAVAKRERPRELQAPQLEAIEAREPEALVEGKYTGQRISLDFQDSDIVPIFRLLADISGYNVVVDPSVKGRLTMKLINVPWDQALEIILKTFALGKRVEGNIMRIAPLSVLVRENDDKAKALQAERQAKLQQEELQTKSYPISYADVEEVKKAIEAAKILSSRGSITFDKRTTTLTIKDVPSNFPQIENLLASLDKAIPQVMIETRIVEVSTTDEKDLGIQWGMKATAANTLSAIGGHPFLNKGLFTGNNFLVDFPSGSAGAGSGSGFTFGILSPDRTFGLDLQLAALQKIGRTKIISNPRVVTTDNKEAMIKQGTSEPFPKLTTEGTISTEFKDVTLETTVTPHITPAGAVKMTIAVKKEDILGTVNIGGSLVPRTSKIEGKTEVLIQNGETVVIGGVYKKTETFNSSGVPWLMKVPVLGWLFKNEHPKEDVSELLIFLTPRIVEKP